MTRTTRLVLNTLIEMVRELADYQAETRKVTVAELAALRAALEAQAGTTIVSQEADTAPEEAPQPALDFEPAEHWRLYEGNHEVTQSEPHPSSPDSPYAKRYALMLEARQLLRQVYQVLYGSGESVRGKRDGKPNRAYAAISRTNAWLAYRGLRRPMTSAIGWNIRHAAFRWNRHGEVEMYVGEKMARVVIAACHEALGTRKEVPGGEAT